MYNVDDVITQDTHTLIPSYLHPSLHFPSPRTLTSSHLHPLLPLTHSFTSSPLPTHTPPFTPSPNPSLLLPTHSSFTSHPSPFPTHIHPFTSSSLTLPPHTHSPLHIFTHTPPSHPHPFLHSLRRSSSLGGLSQFLVGRGSPKLHQLMGIPPRQNDRN